MSGYRVQVVLVAALSVSASALAGPEWPETGDAGDTPNTAQKIFGAPPLDGISGDLDGLLRSGDFQDMFLIRIEDYTTFSMSTEIGGFSSTDFNVQLFLFDKFGVGQLANDDISTGDPDAAMGNTATDGTGFALTSNGFYFVAISGFNSDPLSISGFPIFDQVTTVEVSGPDGFGGSTPIASWNSDGETGHYKVFLTGADRICIGDLDGDNDVDGMDLAALLAAWGTDDFFADFNEDGVVDGADLATLLAAWGRC